MDEFIECDISGYKIKVIFGDFLTYNQLLSFGDLQTYYMTMYITYDKSVIKSINNVHIVNVNHIRCNNIWTTQYQNTFMALLKINGGDGFTICLSQAIAYAQKG